MPATSETGAATKLPEVRLSRHFAAPPALVFKAWTSSRQVRRWFCPADFTVTEAKVQPGHGEGPFEIAMQAPDGVRHWIRGRFTEVAPCTRLAIEMDITDEQGHLLFSAETRASFAEEAGGTRMEVVQTYRLQDPAALWMVEGAPQGWEQTLDRLPSLLAEMAVEAEERSTVHATFRLERLYEAPVAKVWKALTDEEAKAKWFGGVGSERTLIERQMDVRVHGRERLKVRWKGGMVSSFDALYHDVTPNRRLIYSYELHLDERKISVSLATIGLTGEGSRTRLTITEQGAFLDGYDDAGAREHGTGLLLDALGASLGN
ncbi:MAG: SRPBCC family protein [Acetobacteraceae bacterium]